MSNDQDQDQDQDQATFGAGGSMVLDVRGQISDTISIRDAIAKKGSGRRVPMHQELRRALRV